MNAASESEVRTLVESLFPDRSNRLMALEIFSGCIYEANCFGRSHWWVEETDTGLQLKVNGVVICCLGQGTVGLALDRGLWEKAAPGELMEQVWQWDDEDRSEHTQIDARYGRYTPDENQHDEFWSWVRMLSAGAIFASSQSDRVLKYDSKPHSHTALRYLRNEINHHVPDPLID